MSITSGLRWFAAVALLLLLLVAVAAASSHGAGPSPPPDSSRERPSTVVVQVPDSGFHWADAGIGAVAALATTLIALGVALTLRPDRGVTGNPMTGSLVRKE